MDINQKNRADLKAYFVKNAIPQQGQFYDLIDAALNKKEDGVTKSAGNPLCVEAQSTDERPIVHLYDSFGSSTPSYVLSLLPGTTLAGVTSGKGFSIGDGNGSAKARLFIEDTTGNIGIGTVSPSGYKVAIAGTLNVADRLTASAGITVPAGQTVTLHGPLCATAGATVSGGLLNANGGLTVPAGQTLTANGSVVVASSATIAGTLSASGGLTVSSGQTLTANGPLVATSGATISGAVLTASAGATISGAVLTASAGITVPSGQTLTANGSLYATSGATISGSMLTASAGATISGAVLTASNGISVPSGQAITTGGAITAGGLVTANAGLSVTAAALTASAGATISGGVLTASHGISVPTGQAITAGSITAGAMVTANAGLSVTSVALSASAGANISGAALNAQLGANVSGGLLTASAGATITGASLTVGTAAANQTLDVYGKVNANGGISVPSTQTLSALGPVTAGGLITANAGISVPSTQTLNALGPVIAGGLITANGGISVPSTQTLSALGPVTAGGLITANAGISVPNTQTLNALGPVTAGGLITANGGISVPNTQTLSALGPVIAGGLITANAGISVPNTQTLNALGPVTAGGLITANGGISVPNTQTLSALGPVTAGGLITANGGISVPNTQTLSALGPVTAGGLITANGGISVPNTQTLSALGPVTAGGLITANAGISVPSTQTLSALGPVTAGGLITANGGISVPSTQTLNALGPVTASGAINANGGVIVASGKDLTARGTLTVTDTATFAGSFKITGTDFNLDNTTRRSTRTSGVRRALVHESPDSLYVNYAGDYTNGVKLGGQLLMQGPAWMQENSIYLRSAGARGHGLAYFGSNRPFGGSNVDGPGLYGYAGGVLGVIRPAGTNIEGALVLAGGSAASNTGYVSLPSMTDDFSGGITVEAWVYLSTNNNSYGRIIDFGNGAGNSNVLFCQVGTSSALRIDVYNGTSHFYADAAGVLTTGAWMHVAATVDTSGNIKIYKNGVSQTVTTGGTFALPGSTTRTYCYIGKSNWSSDMYIGGKMAHVKVWTRALSSDEISDVVTDVRVVSTANLAAWWPLDEGTGTSARDKSGNSRTGTLSSSGAAYESYQYSALTWDYSNNVKIGNNLSVGSNLTVSGALTVTGDVTARSNSVTVAPEQLRMIRGSIDSNGTISRGSGFTISKAGTGLYDITWSTAFGAAPTVVATQVYPGDTSNVGGDPRDNAVIVGITSAKVRIKTGDNAGNATDRNFGFIAIGT